MTRRETFALGAFGAFAPYLVAWLRALIALQPIPTVSPLYAGVFVVVFVLFVAAGGVMALAWEPDSRWKAVWVGLSIQTIIATFGAELPTR